jgi:uncharacterized protein YecA (UPF0149 family)
MKWAERLSSRPAKIHEDVTADSIPIVNDAKQGRRIKMDIQTGKIYGELKEALREVPKERLRPMIIPPTRRQMVNGKVGRNDLCPCGSGRKFKKCCLVPDTCPLPKEKQ